MDAAVDVMNKFYDFRVEYMITLKWSGYLFSFFFLEIGSCYIAQKGLKLAAIPCFSIPSAGMIGLRQHINIDLEVQRQRSPVPFLRLMALPATLQPLGPS